MPVVFVKFAITFAYAFFGTGSEAFQPNVTVPAAAFMNAPGMPSLTGPTAHRGRRPGALKAVEANLSRIYRKLAVRSRSELAARQVGSSTSGRGDRTPTSTPLERPS